MNSKIVLAHKRLSPAGVSCLHGCALLAGMFFWMAGATAQSTRPVKGRAHHTARKSTQHPAPSPEGPVSYVDPFIGTGGHGHTFLGASVPYGAVQVGPTNIVKGWDWCSGYHYSDSVLIGFSQMHLSGTGIGDLGDVLIMPYTGPVRTERGTQEDPGSGYASYYSHRHETARPGYYSVRLENYGVMAEMTASERVGFHKYTFPQGAPAHIIIDLQQGIGWDSAVETFIRLKDEHTIEGYRYSTGWAKDHRVWFAIRSSVPIKQWLVYDGKDLQQGVACKGNKVKGIISFDKSPGQVLLKGRIVSGEQRECAGQYCSGDPRLGFCSNGCSCKG